MLKYVRVVCVVTILTGIIFSFEKSAFAVNELEYNSSFEVGRWGYDAIPVEYVRNWKSFSQPVVTDETAAQGKYSLRLANPSGSAYISVKFSTMTFMKEAPLTISFYARSDIPNVPVMVRIRCGFNTIMQHTFNLKTGWHRYSFKGTVAKDIDKDYSRNGRAGNTESSGKKGAYQLAFYLTSLKNKPIFQTVWLDGIQVEKGPMTRYAPAKELEASLDMQGYAKKRLLVYDETETDTIRLRVCSQKGAGTFSGTYTITDELTKHVLAKGNLSGELGASGNGVFDFPMPKAPRGLYRVRAKITCGKKTTTAQRVYGIIRDLTQRRTQGPIFFGGSIIPFESARLGLMTEGGDPTNRLACYRRPPELILSFAARMGWQWLHLYDTISTKVNAPTKNRREWDDSDYVVNLAIKNKLDLMSLLTSAGTAANLVKWMQLDKKSENGEPLPDSAAYEIFSEQAARHFKGRITWWENWNEPCYRLTIDEYMPLLKSGWRGIKKGNPDAKVLGLTGTWDRSGDLYGWVRGCLKRGAIDYMDAIAVHGYATQGRNYINEVRKIAKGITGKTFSIWDTESGEQNADPYGFKSAFFDGHAIRDSIAQANECSQSIVNKLANGAARQSRYSLDTVYQNIGIYGRSMIAFDGAPNGDLIAHNAMIDLLVTAKFDRQIPIEGGTVAYLFNDKDGPICVYWNSTLTTTTTMNVPLAKKNLKLLDVFARPVAISGGDTATLPIDANTRYLRGRGIPINEMADALQQAMITGMTPVRLLLAQLSVDQNQAAMVGTFANLRKSPQTIKVRTIQKPQWLKFKPPSTLSLPAHGTRQFVWPLSFTTATATAGLQLVVETDQKSILFSLPSHIFQATKTTQPIVVDAKATESVWGQATQYSLTSWGKVQGSWNEKGLYFFANIQDDQIVNFQERPGTQPWQSDCLELFFDWDRAGDLDQPAYNADDTQLLFIVKSNKPGSRDQVQVGIKTLTGNKRFAVDQVQMVSRKTKTGYVMEIGIPWSCLKSVGQKRRPVIGFTMAGRDLKANFIERKRPVWQGTDDNHKNTYQFGLLVLKEMQ